MLSIGHTPGALDPARGADAAADAAAARAWAGARDAVLCGLVHALSNRVGTVVAAGGLLDGGSAEAAGRVLGGEAARLEALVEQFRLATADPFGADDAPEPMLPGDVVRAAAALHAHAAAPSAGAVALEGADDAPPVVASRAGLVHALLVLLGGTAGVRVVRVGAAPGGRVAIRTEPAAEAGDVATAVWLLRRSAATTDADGAILLRQLGAG